MLYLLACTLFSKKAQILRGPQNEGVVADIKNSLESYYPSLKGGKVPSGNQREIGCLASLHA